MLGDDHALVAEEESAGKINQSWKGITMSLSEIYLQMRMRPNLVRPGIYDAHPCRRSAETAAGTAVVAPSISIRGFKRSVRRLRRPS